MKYVGMLTFSEILFCQWYKKNILENNLIRKNKLKAINLNF